MTSPTPHPGAPRRVLMVGPLWPPLGNIGTRRVVRLARHLPAHGWQPVLLTDDPPGYGYPLPKPLDESTAVPAVEHHTAPGWLPGAALRRALFGAAKRAGHPRALPAAAALSSRFVLPDHYPEWTPAAVWKARQIPAVDAVWTTGRPYGMFVVALAVAKALGVPCVLDYRDPWTVDLAPSRLPGWPLAAYTALERGLLARADGVAYVNQDMLDRNAAAFAPKPGAEWAVIPNGFDRAEYEALIPSADPEPTLRYTGGFYGQRSAVPALAALRALGDRAPRLEIYGELDTAGQADLAAQPLGDRVHVQGRVGVQTVRAHQLGAAALLLAVGPEHRTALTGKIFDYVCAGRPIIGYGPPDADAGRLIRAAGVGVWIDAGDTAALAKAFAAAREGTLPYAPDEAVLAPYSAEQMAARTAALLDHCAGR